MIIKTPEAKAPCVESALSTQSGSHHYVAELFKFITPLDAAEGEMQKPQGEILSTHEFLSLATLKQKSLAGESTKEDFSAGDNFPSRMDESPQIDFFITICDSGQYPTTIVRIEADISQWNAEIDTVEKLDSTQSGFQFDKIQTHIPKTIEVIPDPDLLQIAHDHMDFGDIKETAKQDKEPLTRPIETTLSIPVAVQAAPAVDFDPVSSETGQFLDLKVPHQIVRPTSQAIPEDSDVDKKLFSTSSPVYSSSITKYSVMNGANASPDRFTEMHSQAINSLSYINPNLVGAGLINYYNLGIDFKIESIPDTKSSTVADTDHPITAQLKSNLHQFLSEYSLGQSEITKGKIPAASFYRPVASGQNEYFQKRYSVLEVNGRIIIRIRDFFLSDTNSSRLFNQLQKFCNDNFVPSLTVTLNGITKTLKGT